MVVALLEEVDRATATLPRHERDRVEDWLGHVRVIPRFRTPLEKELSETALGDVGATR